MLQLRIEGEGLVFEKEIGEALTKDIMAMVIDRVFAPKSRPREVHVQAVPVVDNSIPADEESSEPP
ncbi:MAG: hypothetical protein H6Q72_923 [Firmicutes bacterium]|nr:hypothetical protein [Bacillota bacterium]